MKGTYEHGMTVTHVDSKAEAKRLRREFNKCFPDNRYTYEKGLNGYYAVIGVSKIDCENKTEATK